MTNKIYRWYDKSVYQLKEMCRALGLKMTGDRMDLIERIFDKEKDNQKRGK